LGKGGDGTVAKGFAIKNSEGKFLKKNGEWEEVTVYDAYVFPGSLGDIGGFIAVNGLDIDCEIYFIMKGKETIIQRMKKIGPETYKFLPLEEKQT